MEAYHTIVAAACHMPDIAPRCVASAKALVESNTAAALLKEGLRGSGCGAGVNSDADAVVVKGALHDQCDEDFSLVAQALFYQGMPEVQSGTMRVERSLLKVATDSNSQIATLVCQSMEDLNRLMTAWSPKRLSEEIESVAGMMQHMALCLLAFAAARWDDLRQVWGPLLSNWLSLKGSMATGAWPPQGIETSAQPHPPAETCFNNLKELVDSATMIIDRCARYSPDMKTSVADLLTTVLRLYKHRDLRAATWNELQSASHAFDSDARTHDELVQDFTSHKVGMLTHVLHIAENRPIINPLAQRLPVRLHRRLG